MKLLLLTCLFYVFCHVSEQRSVLYSFLGNFSVQSKPSTTYSCSLSKTCCAVACTRNYFCAFFSFNRDDDVCMLYEQCWISTVYNSSWSTYKAAWQVIQRREDGSVDFYRNWTEYENGFGNPESEFWIGLANLHNLIRLENAMLRIDLMDFDGSTVYAVYRTFSISGPEDNYRINIGGYIGNAGDSMARQNNMQFTTFDRDHDINGYANCAEYYHGAWWYEACHHSNLNGLYKSDGASGYDGVAWYYWRPNRSLKRVEMKIKK